MYDLNQTLFLALNHFAGQNNIVDHTVIVVASATPYLFIAYLVYAWLSGRQHESLYAGYAATFGVMLNQILSMFYFHNRPFMDHVGHSLLAHVAENSFPSDHATFTLSIALVLMLFASMRKIAIVALGFGIACGIARVYCGVHYPSDIAGSMIVSLFVANLIWAFKSQLRELNLLIIAQWHKYIKVGFCGDR